MALFLVRSNPRWQAVAILENYSGITRFPRDSTAFLFDAKTRAVLQQGYRAMPRVFPTPKYSMIAICFTLR